MRADRILFRLAAAAAVCGTVCLAAAGRAFAQTGDMGLFGGISEGRRLPKTTDVLLNQIGKANGKKNQPNTYIYKEMIFLSGKPLEFEGMMDVTDSGGVQDGVDVGTYTQTYRVYSSASTNPSASVTRDIVFTVNYRRENQQIIQDYAVDRWTETIEADGVTYTLDPRVSGFDLSVIEDRAPGVHYYRGDISRRSVYSIGAEAPAAGAAVATEAAAATETAAATEAAIATSVTLEASDAFYGYDCVWSATETHRLDETVSRDDWQMQVQVRPSVSVRKTLRYTANEPTAISFEGNYKEVCQNQSGLRYDIFIKPRIYPDEAASGSASIATRNTFEQLIAPDVSFLKGHAAEENIRKLFSMQILTGDPMLYQPHQAITRGQYVTALTRAIKLASEPIAKPARGRKTPPPTVFSDVPPDRPEYPSIMAAYRGDLAIGRDNASFNFDAALERQEAIAILVRALGLTHLASNPTSMTTFTDDHGVADWAKRETAAAVRLRLILPDAEGRIRPQDLVSKAEAADFLNRLVEYMRSDIASDYADHIVNFAQ
ncbi:MAG: S-layer homology domain-containing protein [Clostridiales bacterium]|jgi:hypothetical protein|nr:S-layer homology domain-containing protein [Clostridiales bacterium]